MAEPKPESSGELPELKSSRMEATFKDEERIGEDAKQELLAKAQELASKVENLLQPTPEQEVVWKNELYPPMTEPEEKNAAYAAGLDRTDGPYAGVETRFGFGHSLAQILENYNLELPEEELDSLSAIDAKRYELLGENSPEANAKAEELLKELTAKIKEKILASTNLNFRRSTIYCEPRLMERGKDKPVGSTSNIQITQHSDKVYIKARGAMDPDSAAQLIVDRLKVVK